MKPRWIAIVMLCCAPGAWAAEAHVHGAGHLTVAIDGKRIDLDLELPLDTVVGFEHAPRNDRERAALAGAGKLLQDAGKLFAPTGSARCHPVATEVHLPFGGENKTPATAPTGHDAHGQHEAEGHADVDASYAFECAQPAALTGIDVTLFKALAKLQRLAYERVGPKGQGGGTLTPQAPTVRW